MRTLDEMLLINSEKASEAFELQERRIREAEEFWASQDEEYVFNNPNGVSYFYEQLNNDVNDILFTTDGE